MVLTVEDLGISFGSNHVLKSLSFEVGENEVLGVIGPNGAGKTVMLNILTGILKATKGKVSFMGNDITKKSVTERCRMGFGRTFQVPRTFENMTVFENVIVGGVYGDHLSERQAKERAVEMLELIGLLDRADWMAGKLSLLDRKRLEIGRALASNPKILMFDEVAGGLTESEVEGILQIVQNIKDRGISIVWIEHVLKTMREGTDRILCLAEGRNVICDKPDTVMNSKEVCELYLGAEEDEPRQKNS
ncbi:ABC transporter ATP-binding protein [Christensenellaceae bacterium OttesenSCG-928-K19]|nr:ABC transporter ATP-binding protein [Christensenellaceae bacterium OttesenSCG-928-K19]